MTTSIDERISALVDGESGAFEARRLTRELLSNEKLKARWSRFHLIGDAMRNELPPRIEPDFSAAVLAKINGDMPGYDHSLAHHQPRWLKPLAGLAIAASVATVSVFVLQSLTSRNDVQPQIEVASTPTTIPSAIIPEPKATPVAVIQSGSSGNATTAQSAVVPGSIKTLEAKIVDSRMNSYLATHAEYATQPMLMPQVRVVGFE